MAQLAWVCVVGLQAFFLSLCVYVCFRCLRLALVYFHRIFFAHPVLAALLCGLKIVLNFLFIYFFFFASFGVS